MAIVDDPWLAESTRFTAPRRISPAAAFMLLPCALMIPMELITDPFWDTASQIVQRLIALMAIIVGLKCYRPLDRRPWLLLGAFFLITGLRNVFRLAVVWGDGHSGQLSSSPVELAISIVASICLAAVSIVIMRSRRPRGDWALHDAWVIGVAILIVGVILISVPVWKLHGFDTGFALFGIVAVLRDTLIMVPLLAILFSEQQRPASLNLYIAGMGIGLAGEIGYLGMNGVAIGYSLNSRAAVAMITTGHAMVAAAALLPSMREICSPSATPRPPWNWTRTLGMAAAVAAPVIALLASQGLNETDLRLVAGGLGILLLAMVLRLRSAVVSSVSSELRLVKLAHHDELTDLGNRRYLGTTVVDSLRTELDRHGRLAVACCYIDVDNLKDVNDRMGHGAGDRLIRTVAGSLQSLPTEMDSKALRIGGDEFLVMTRLDTRDPATDAIHFAERVDAAIRASDANTDDLEIRASIGCAWIEVDTGPQPIAIQLDHLVDCADLAQVKAKSEGGARVRHYDSELSVSARRRVSIHRHVRQAWQRGEMSMVYQTVVDLEDGQVFGAESLLRWRHPELGPVAPPDAIEAAEQQGLGAALGLDILDGALQALRRLEPAKRHRVGVNLSVGQLQPSAVEQLAERIALSGLGPFLWLEITEQALVQNRHVAATALQNLRQAGVVVAIDDFGTGYCGLDYLCTLPVDIVKLDGIFAREVAASPTRRRVAQLGVQLAESIGAVALAEGIEDMQMAILMRDLGCRYAQGYALRRPAAELGDALAPLSAWALDGPRHGSA